MALVKNHALVLRSRPYRETSLLFSAITPEYGTLHFLGKGFREKHKGFLAPFEPLTLLEVVFYERTRSQLQLLKEVDVAEYFPQLRKNLVQYAYGCYFAETVGQLVLEGNQEVSIFNLLLCSLERIGRTDIERISETFHVQLLEKAGLLPQLYTCVGCGSTNLTECLFDYEQGGVVCKKCSVRVRIRLPISTGTLETLRYLSREPFDTALKLKTGRKTRAELKGILRRFMAFRLDRELRALDVLDQIVRRRLAL